MHKEHHAEIEGRSVNVTLSPSASRALAQRNTPLLAEMELYFSCLIRKQVRFRENCGDNTIPVTEQLHISFRPVMTRACGKDYEGDEPPLTDFPIAKTQAYVPRWLHIDYAHGQWQGEFGYNKD